MRNCLPPRKMEIVRESPLLCMLLLGFGSLASRGLSSSKHTGILSLFNVHFVKSGICSREVAEVYNDLFDNRQEGDYADLYLFSGQVEPSSRSPNCSLLPS